MTKLRLCVVVFIVSAMMVCGCASPSKSPHAGVAADHELDSVAWLAGSWSGVDGDTLSEEHWTQPVAGSMIGMNRTVAIEPNKTVFFEFLRIEKNEEGIVYLASPKGRQPPTPFKLVGVTPSKIADRQRVVFENAGHDFPQRIIYRLDGDVLHGRIEGDQDGKPMSEEWKWRRVK